MIEIESAHLALRDCVAGVGKSMSLAKGYYRVKDLRVRFFAGLVLLLSSCLQGCSGPPEAPVEKLVSGSGTVKIDGEPAANVQSD